MFLEDRDFAKANEYCDRVLDVEPENARAYLGKFMADLYYKRQEDLEKLCTKLHAKFPNDNTNYVRAVRFADESLRDFLVGLEKKWKEYVYNEAIRLMKNGLDLKALKAFNLISEYKDVAERKKEIAYNYCLKLMKKGDYRTALERFQSYPLSGRDYRDVEEKIKDCVQMKENRSIQSTGVWN